MNYAQFQEHFENAAEAEAAWFDAMSVSELVSDIRAGRFGDYYQIWYSLAKRAKPSEVNALLLSFLDSPAEYLQRYHCAAALILVNKLKGVEAHQLSAGTKQSLAENLEKVRNRLTSV